MPKELDPETKLDWAYAVAESVGRIGGAGNNEGRNLAGDSLYGQIMKYGEISGLLKLIITARFSR